MSKQEFKTTEEIRRDFLHSFEALQSLARAYDEGQKGAAPQLAIIIMNFVYDRGKKYVSILKQIRRKDDILFHNTATPVTERNLWPQMSLIMTQVTFPPLNDIEYFPVLDNGPLSHYCQPDQPFDKWWKAGIFMEGAGSAQIRRRHRRVFTREDFVVDLRHCEGGHVSTSLRETLVELRRNNLAGWVREVGGEQCPPEYAPE